ncbi:uncharacterized protein LOC106711893 [Papilio machaon]|uniref:uncharacterized protein LOC106711893 n=1 Tax=Papilio machaon TaxID=76193 RepID=UPI001E664CB6|nr:uncharacterized protein LOC106711893 [Papilio machaon]
MHWTIFYICVPLLCCAAVNIKALTESMGQEVIEMDAPIKELPPEIEEEPSAENESEIKSVATTISSSTKSTTIKETKRKLKETDRTRSNQEEEEARIEKELADLYKDSSDYKADSAEVSKDSHLTTQASTAQSETEDDTLKPVARAREDFKFQPDTNNKADVERFRTSVDIISCDKQRLTGATVTMSPLSSAGHQFIPSARPIEISSAFVTILSKF